MAHPVLAAPGWWATPPQPRAAPVTRRPSAPRLLILGALGTLGSEFVRCCERRGLGYLALTRADIDVGEPMSVKRAVAASRPWAVVNCTGYVNVDRAESERDQCLRTNALGAANVAEACDRTGARLLAFSTDLVFDGDTVTPYLETDRVHPINAYGESKRAAEDAILERLPNALIVRTSACFGPWDTQNFVTRSLAELASKREVLATGHVVSPTYVPALVDTALDLLIDAEAGIWHLTNQGAVSWAALARLAAASAGYDTEQVRECEPLAVGWVARRPRFSALGSARGTVMPRLEESLDHFLATVPQSRFARSG
jgi:dTDP-4-dehydrorhamnose reductase